MEQAGWGGVEDFLGREGMGGKWKAEGKILDPGRIGK